MANPFTVTATDFVRRGPASVGWADIPIGTADVTRRVLIFLQAGTVPTSITIGGIDADIHAQAEYQNDTDGFAGFHLLCASAEVPTGTTADIITSGGQDIFTAGVYSIVGAFNVFDQADISVDHAGASTSTDFTYSTPANGVTISHVGIRDVNAVTFTYTNFTEDATMDTGNNIYSGAQFTPDTEQIDQVETVTFSESVDLVRHYLWVSFDIDYDGLEADTTETNLSFTLDAALTGEFQFTEGTSSLVFDQTGELEFSFDLVGESTLSFVGSADLFATAELTGDSLVTFTPSGLLIGASAIEGSSTLTFSETGDVFLFHALIGDIDLTFTLDGGAGFFTNLPYRESSGANGFVPNNTSGDILHFFYDEDGNPSGDLGPGHS